MLEVLQDREAYLRARIVAKQSVGWEYAYDQREQAALEWAIRQLGGEPRPSPSSIARPAPVDPR